MRLGVLSTSFPRYRGDAAGHFVASLVELVRARGHTVEVVAAGSATCAREERASRGYAPTELGAVTEPSLRVTRLPSSLFYRGGAPDALDHRALPAALSFAARLGATALARAATWDGAVAHWLAPSALAALPVRGPLLAIAHGGDVHLLRRTNLLPATLGLLLARRARLAFASAELAAMARAAAPPWLRRLFDERSLVQPMGVDLAHFSGARARHVAPRRGRYLLTLSRLVPLKGVELAVRALAHLPEDLALVIAGDGPERARLAELARPFGDRVELVGELPAAARDAYLAHAAALLLPSRRLPEGRSEGTPVAALEALACGVPVLATAVGGLAELAPAVRKVGGDSGALEEAAAPEVAARWAAQLEQLLASPPSAQDLARAAADHDWRRVEATLWRHWMGASAPAPCVTPLPLLT